MPDKDPNEEQDNLKRLIEENIDNPFVADFLNRLFNLYNDSIKKILQSSNLKNVTVLDLLGIDRETAKDVQQDYLEIQEELTNKLHTVSKNLSRDKSFFGLLGIPKTKLVAHRKHYIEAIEKLISNINSINKEDLLSGLQQPPSQSKSGIKVGYPDFDDILQTHKRQAAPEAKTTSEITDPGVQHVYIAGFDSSALELFKDKTKPTEKEKTEDRKKLSKRLVDMASNTWGWGKSALASVTTTLIQLQGAIFALILSMGPLLSVLTTSGSPIQSLGGLIGRVGAVPIDPKIKSMLGKMPGAGRLPNIPKLGKVIPGLGTVVSVLQAGAMFDEGDTEGALMALAAAGLGTIPWVGTSGAVGIHAALAERERQIQKRGGETDDPEWLQGLADITENHVIPGMKVLGDGMSMMWEKMKPALNWFAEDSVRLLNSIFDGLERAGAALGHLTVEWEESQQAKQKIEREEISAREHVIRRLKRQGDLKEHHVAALEAPWWMPGTGKYKRQAESIIQEEMQNMLPGGDMGTYMSPVLDRIQQNLQEAGVNIERGSEVWDVLIQDQFERIKNLRNMSQEDFRETQAHRELMREARIQALRELEQAGEDISTEKFEEKRNQIFMRMLNDQREISRELGKSRRDVISSIIDATEKIPAEYKHLIAETMTELNEQRAEALEDPSQIPVVIQERQQLLNQLEQLGDDEEKNREVLKSMSDQLNGVIDATKNGFRGLEKEMSEIFKQFLQNQQTAGEGPGGFSFSPQPPSPTQSQFDAEIRDPAYLQRIRAWRNIERD